MPVYEYECPVCKHKEEHFISSAKKKTTFPCEVCGKDGKVVMLKRIISLSSFHLKGGGWFKDNYSSKKKDS